MSDVATRTRRIQEGRELPQNKSTVKMPKVAPAKPEAPKAAKAPKSKNS